MGYESVTYEPEQIAHSAQWTRASSANDFNTAASGLADADRVRILHPAGAVPAHRNERRADAGPVPQESKPAPR